jgi:hypothetical protein
MYETIHDTILMINASKVFPESSAYWQYVTLLGTRTRPSSSLNEIGHFGRRFYDADHLSPPLEELQAKNGWPRLPALSLPDLG